MASYLMLLTYLGVKKKLVAASNKKDNRELQPWQKAITIDLYWSCSSSHGDVERDLKQMALFKHTAWQDSSFTASQALSFEPPLQNNAVPFPATSTLVFCWQNEPHNSGRYTTTFPRFEPGLVLSSHDRFPRRGSVDKDVLRKSGGSCSARDTEVTEQEGRVISVKR
ncbi:unnamed protein product [Gadus morhua 'NCC']